MVVSCALQHTQQMDCSARSEVDTDHLHGKSRGVGFEWCDNKQYNIFNIQHFIQWDGPGKTPEIQFLNPMSQTMSENPPDTTGAPSLLADGVLRARDLEKRGLSRQRIQRLTARGELLRLGRGLYSRPDATVTENHTIAQVFARVPEGILCLLSALQFHNLTTQNPWQVWLMIDRHARTPKMNYPPLRVVRSGDEALAAGVEKHEIEGVTVRVTNVNRTVTDCFKYRNKIGLAIALEALKECLAEGRTDRAALHHYAHICRVERVMQPYLEALAA